MKAEWKQKVIGRRVQQGQFVHTQQYAKYTEWQSEFMKETGMTKVEEDYMTKLFASSFEITPPSKANELFKRLSPEHQMRAIHFKLVNAL